MSKSVLNTESRDLNLTKGELNTCRQQGKIPAVLFGKGMDSLPLFVTLTEFNHVFHDQGKIFEIKAGSDTHLVNAKEIQTNAIGTIVLHIDFLKLKRGQATTVTVPVSLVGEAAGAKEGGIIQIIEEKIALTGKPKDLPDTIEIDISGLAVGDSILAKDIKLSKGVTHAMDEDKTIVTCSAPKTQEEPEPTEGDLNPEAVTETGTKSEEKENIDKKE